jgi:hypothetical protein
MPQNIENTEGVVYFMSTGFALHYMREYVVGCLLYQSRLFVIFIIVYLLNIKKPKILVLNLISSLRLLEITENLKNENHHLPPYKILRYCTSIS